MVLPERFELSTSPLPRECSTPELRQLSRWLGCAVIGNKPGSPSDAVVRNDAAFATTGPGVQAAFSGFFVNALIGGGNLAPGALDTVPSKDRRTYGSPAFCA